MLIVELRKADHSVCCDSNAVLRKVEEADEILRFDARWEKYHARAALDAGAVPIRW